MRARSALGHSRRSCQTLAMSGVPTTTDVWTNAGFRCRRSLAAIAPLQSFDAGCALSIPKRQLSVRKISRAGLREVTGTVSLGHFALIEAM
jgi:hypothetical protein